MAIFCRHSRFAQTHVGRGACPHRRAGTFLIVPSSMGHEIATAQAPRNDIGESVCMRYSGSTPTIDIEPKNNGRHFRVYHYFIASAEAAGLVCEAQRTFAISMVLVFSFRTSESPVLVLKCARSASVSW